MNNKTYNLIVTVLVLVIVIGGGMLLYRNLQDDVILPVTTEQPDPTVETAPDFSFQDSSEGIYSLSDFRGKPVILNFWATWCGYCKMEMPDFDEKYKQYGDDVHFLMVNVTDGNQETVETASAFVAEEGYSFPVYYDTTLEAAMSYPTSGLPVTFIIDAEGAVIAWQQGMMTAENLQKGIDMVLQ